MSITVHCPDPDCGKEVGEFGMNASGTTTCPTCGTTIDLSEETGVGGEPFCPDGIEDPTPGERVRTVGGIGTITQIHDGTLIIELQNGSTDMRSVDEVEYADR